MDLLEFAIMTLRLILAGFLAWGGLLCAVGLGWIKLPAADAGAAEREEPKGSDGLLKAP